MSNWLQQNQQDLSLQKQQELGKPLVDPTGFDPKDQEFLNLVERLIADKTIDLMQPSSLLNRSVYDRLSEDNQGKVDQEALLLLTRIREIHGLWNMTKEVSFQLQNLINACRLYKERVESISGDVFLV